MTYKNLVNFIKENTHKAAFDLTFPKVKSKVIFTIGEGASNVSAMLSSVMSACEIPHSRYINIDYFKLRDRFIRHENPILIDELCKAAEKIKRKAKSNISSDDLLFTIALSLLDGEYIIIEMSEDFYKSVINRIDFEPFAILLCSLDDEKNADLIKTLPCKTHFCALSQKENYDYIRHADENGRKMAFVSQNKYFVKSSNLLFADFYHFSYLYRLHTIDQSNIILAILVIESAALLLGAPRAYIYKGLSSAILPDDLNLNSLEPIVLLRIGDDNFNLPKGLICEKITDIIPSHRPSSNTVFYGNIEYIIQVKKAMGN